ncbi:MAG TPA: GNAT family N-acetyltransferase [Acidimicrobiia bacterium]
MTSQPEVVIRDDLSENAYVIEVDGQRAGKAEYRIRENQVVFTHTEIDEAFEGRGLGSRLARHALDDVRRKGMRIVPRCPFIAAYVRRHSEYQDMVDND